MHSHQGYGIARTGVTRHFTRRSCIMLFLLKAMMLRPCFLAGARWRWWWDILASRIRLPRSLPHTRSQSPDLVTQSLLPIFATTRPFSAPMECGKLPAFGFSMVCGRGRQNKYIQLPETALKIGAGDVTTPTAGQRLSGALTREDTKKQNTHTAWKEPTISPLRTYYVWST